MGKLGGFSYREVIKRLRFFGFELQRQGKGSHEFWYNKKKNLFTTVPRHNKDIKEGTLKSILNQAKINTDDFLDFGK